MRKKIILHIISLIVGFFSCVIFFGFGGYCLFVMDWHGVMNKFINAVVLMLIFTASVYFIHLAGEVKKRI